MIESPGCPDCRDELDHCHAVWLVHDDGHEECIVAACDVGGDAHVLVVACREVDPACP